MRPLLFLLVFVLSACTLEETGGEIVYDLNLESSYVLSGGTLQATLTSPDLDTLIVSAADLELNVRRVEGALELSLTLPETLEPGAAELSLTLSTARRETVVPVAITVLEGSLSLSQDQLELPLGQAGTVTVQSAIEGAEAELVLASPDLVGAALEGDVLSVTPLGVCEPCVLELSLHVDTLRVVEASLEVVTVPSPQLALTLEPSLLELNRGEQAAFELVVTQTGEENVALAFNSPAGLDVVYPQESAAARLTLLVIASNRAPTGVNRLEVTATAGTLEATAEMFVDIKEAP